MHWYAWDMVKSILVGKTGNDFELSETQIHFCSNFLSATVKHRQWQYTLLCS